MKISLQEQVSHWLLLQHLLELDQGHNLHNPLAAATLTCSESGAKVEDIYEEILNYTYSKHNLCNMMAFLMSKSLCKIIINIFPLWLFLFFTVVRSIWYVYCL